MTEAWPNQAWVNPIPADPRDGMNQDALLYKRIKELLHYNPETGIFTWIQSTNRKIKLGDEAGCQNNTGYIRIRFDGKYYQAHRLAILYMTGKWPSTLQEAEYAYNSVAPNIQGEFAFKMENENA